MGLVELIEKMKREGVLKNKRLEEALWEVPREYFVPKEYRDQAYVDYPLPIGFGQTISQPSTVVIMTQLLDPQPGEKILEIGSGSGWQAALLGYLVSPKGKVYTIERIKELANFAEENLRKAGIKNVEIFVGDGTLGLKEKAPFDKIIITAATPPEIPKPLEEQLKEGGKLLAPIGDRYTQRIVLFEKQNGKLIEKIMDGWFYAFVPLIGKYGFK